MPLSGPRGAGLAGTLVAVMVGVLLAGALPSRAVAPAPADVIHRAADDVIGILQDPGLQGPARAAERRAALRRVVEPIFDFDEMARRALGPHWRGRTDTERRHFTTLFRRLVERAYFSKLEGYHGEHVRYLGVSTDGSFATVRTQIVTTRGTEVPVDYHLLRRDGRWRVYDVLIEGVSLVENYRVQFTTIIDESSYSALVARMEAKVDARGRG